MNPPPNAPTAESVADRARQHIVENNAVHEVKFDKSYIGEWKRYQKWAQAQQQLNLIPPSEKVLTRENVDLYFSSEVVKRKIQPTGARRIVSALQKAANEIEYNDGVQSFRIEDGPPVKRSLMQHERAWMEMRSKTVVDPHANLPTDVLTPEDSLKCLSVIKASQNWRDLSLSWTMCEISLTQ